MTADDTIRDFYFHVYQPARHAGERHRRTRAEAVTQLNNLSQWWQTRCGAAGSTATEPRLKLFDELGQDTITLAMAWLVERQRAPSTANKFRATLNAMWELAHDRGLVSSRPRNRKYRCELEDPIALTPAEKTAVLEQAGRVPGRVGDVPAGDWWLLLLLLLCNTGARITVLRETPTACLDGARGELLLPARWQKQRRDQRLALWPSTRQQIARLRIVERGLVRLLDDWPYRLDTLRRQYSRLILAPAGVSTDRKHKFHCLRKTLGSEVAAAGGIVTAQQVLGHSSMSVTERYIDPRYAERPCVTELVADPLVTADGRPRLRVYREDTA